MPRASATSSSATRVAENLVILVVIAVLAGAFSLILLNVLWRGQNRAFWGREEAIRRSRRREQRVFLMGIGLVIAMGLAWVVVERVRQPSCPGQIAIVTGPDGAPLECLCEKGRRAACFDPGP